MEKKYLSKYATALLILIVMPVYAAHPLLRSPADGVLCDRYSCADGKTGISRDLTEKYLGKEAATKLDAQGDFDASAFTFANGIFCDTKERLCREDRYYGANGKPSGAISSEYTKLLFGN